MIFHVWIGGREHNQLQGNPKADLYHLHRILPLLLLLVGRGPWFVDQDSL